MKKLVVVFNWVLLIAALCLCGFSVMAYPPQVNEPDDGLPPLAGEYVSPAQWHAAYAQGILIRGVNHKGFTKNLPVPKGTTTQSHKFDSVLDMEISTDGGKTWHPASGPASVSVDVTHTSDDPDGTGHYDTEMTALDGTNTVPGVGTVRLRESPTLPSKGKTTVRAIAGGYLVSSFFDIFTELSMDGGATWLPAQQAAHVELRNDPSQVPGITAPSPLLPSPNGAYVSPQEWHALYANGIVISNVSHRFFTDSYPPPVPGTNEQHTFSSILQMQVSTDGGATFHSVIAPATVKVQVSSLGSGSDSLYDTEMLQLDGSITEPGLPQIKFRESPTLPSKGQTLITSQSDGTYRISSFFDIFTEVSLDGGVTWSASLSGAGRVELQDPAPEQTTSGTGVPPFGGEYISPDVWHVLYQNGIIISNVSHFGFLNNQPPLPPDGQTEVHTFDSQVSMDVLQPGQPPVHVVAPAAVTVQITSTIDSGGTRYFDTEMLQLDITGSAPGLPQGVMIRESPTKASLGRTSFRQDNATGTYRLSSFFTIFTDLSLDGGQTWSSSVSGPSTVRVRMPPPIPVAVTCPTDITVTAAGPGGAVVTFTPTASGGCGGTVSVTATPASGSLFPIGTTTVTVVAKDPCGNTARCLFHVTVNPPATSVPEYFFKQPGVPPTDGVYISPAQWHAAYANGIVIRNVKHRGFLQNFDLPPAGGTTVHSFSSTVDFEVSTTGTGGPYSAATASADVTVRVTHSFDSSGTSFFDTEMLALDLTSGTLRLRESPTLPSRGQTTARAVAGGYMINSFFDVFTELSADGGNTWLPGDQAGHVEVRPDIKNVDPVTEPTNLVPPPNDQYVSPQQWHILYNSGIVITNVRHKFFTQSLVPPTTGTQNHSFSSTLDLEVSTDGGLTFRPVRVTVPTQVTLTSAGSDGSGRYDTEMTSLGGAGGFVVSGTAVRVRESPTEPSRGQTELTLGSDGSYRISSFFDIFTEITTDGGATWHPSDNGPVRMQLSSLAPEQGVTTPSVPPPGEYISPDKWHAYYQQGIIISNVSHQIFLSEFPLPTSGSITDNFNSGLQMDVWLPGQPPQHVVLTAPCTAKLTATTKDTEGVRFFDTEMLSLDVAGLPNGMMIRESPTRQSTGRLSSRPDPNNPGQFRVSSFFDIFTELSTDGGQTWFAATNAPPTMRLRSPIGVPAVTIACPADIYTTATSAAGAVVAYATPAASGGCTGPLTVTCTPASGSVFAIGTTTVTCVAQDSCGNKAICTFNVIVRPPVKKRVFPSSNLPPLNGQYVSPADWHAAYASGIYITNASHKRFTQNFPPPPPNGTDTHTFTSQIEMDVLQPGQLPLHVVVPNVPVTVQVTSTGSSGGDQVYATEMLQLDIQGGNLPAGMRVRESPTKASTGEVRIQPTTGGFAISSFFDVWTELSMDGGNTWDPTTTPARMELAVDTTGVSANPSNAHLESGNLTLTVPTHLGLFYFIEAKDNLVDHPFPQDDWFTLSGGIGTGKDAIQTDFYSSSLQQRFYRVRMEEVTIPNPTPDN